MNLFPHWLSSHFNRFVNSKKKRIIFTFFFSGFCVFLIIPLPRFPKDYSTVVLDSNGGILHVFLNKKQQWCMPPNQKTKIPYKLRTAVLEYEDRWFEWHPGVNPVAVVRAIRQNARSGEIKSGASTITMQAARLSRPKARTVPNKLLEMLQAFKLEALYSKNRILHLYLDHAPYGRNVVGIRAASLRYLGKEPERLSWAEAAGLAVLPNSPGLIAPGVRTELLKKKRDGLLNRLFQKGIINPETHELALAEPVPRESRPFASAARHLAQELYANAGPGRFEFRTTVHKEIQSRVEQLVADHAAERLRPLGIRNAAVLVAETTTGKVRAYVGSQDFFNDDRAGQVNGVIAPRSPGSLLKPFLYALAMDRGILLPETRIRDVPSYYGAFSPSNAGEQYDGLVTVQDALIRSLNVPAVRVLYTFGVFPFYAFLKSAGVKTLFRTPGDYGLPLILGGAEVTLWDMAVLYRGLGNGGRFRPLQIMEQDQSSGAVSNAPILISSGACYLTLNMLRDLRRPDSEAYWELYQDQRPIAWKTGTSYGQRDAWAAGVSPQWTIVVWAGNFEGEGNANLSGASSAGTLLFSIHNSLPGKPEKGWFEAPVEDIDPVVLCLESGYLAGPCCGKTQSVSAPRFMKPLPMCPYHQKLYFSGDGMHQVCSMCWTPGDVREENRLIYPPDVAQYLRESGKTAADVPPHDPKCSAHSSDGVLEILYPQENARLWIPRDLGGQLEKVTLRAAHVEKQSLLHWYLDGRYLGTSRDRHVKACLLSEGAHTLDVVDENGNRADVQFSAELGN